jgi:hypothetical protein
MHAPLSASKNHSPCAAMLAPRIAPIAANTNRAAGNILFAPVPVDQTPGRSLRFRVSISNITQSG